MDGFGLSGDARVAQDRTIAYQPALDGLRAVAVGSVLLYHLGGGVRSAVARGGFLGVDIFFVLSGFLITTLLLEERFATGRIRLGAFWGRRARRLLPALVVLLVLVALLVRFAYPAVLRDLVVDDLPYLLTYSQNWHLAAWHGESSAPLAPTWSLSVEEQFYFVWPLVLLGLTALLGTSRRRLFGVMAALAVVGGLWAAWRFDAGGLDVYYATDTRSPELFVGAALATLGVGVGAPAGPRARRWLDGLGVVALLVMAVVLVRARLGAVWFDGGFLVLAVATAVVIAAAVQPTGPVRAVLAPAPLVAIGKISYGLYLFHFPVYAWASTWDLAPTARHVLALAITAGLATASYFLVERPIRMRRWRAAVVVPVAGVVAATAMALTVTAPAGPTARSRHLAYLLAQAASEAPDGATRVLVVGGLRAQLLMVGGQGGVRSGGSYGVAVGTPGCGVLGVSRRCRSVPDDLDPLADALGADVVVLALEEPDLADYVATGRDPGARLDALLRRAAGRDALVLLGPCGADHPEPRAQLEAAVRRAAARRAVPVLASPFVTCDAGVVERSAPEVWATLDDAARTGP